MKITLAVLCSCTLVSPLIRAHGLFVFNNRLPPSNLVGLEGFTLRPQIIMSGAPAEDHQVQFLADCPTVERVVLQSSIDFAHWMNLATNVVVGGTAKFSIAPSAEVTYFRGVS